MAVAVKQLRVEKGNPWSYPESCRERHEVDTLLQVEGHTGHMEQMHSQYKILEMHHHTM